MSLDALRQALAPQLAAHPDVQVGSLHAAAAEFLTLTVEPEHGPHRFLRAAVAPLNKPITMYTMRWSSYRGTCAEDECDGGTFGDLAFTLSAIDHWIFEGLPWRQVPEFSPPKSCRRT
jgi:hypothetical protein